MTATTILSDNGASSGSAGIKTTGGNDGTLQLQTTTSGGTATTAVTIDTSQNVGVGASASSDARITLGRMDSTQEGGQLNFNNALSNTNAWAIDVYGSTSTPRIRFIDMVASTERMTIDSNGSLLVGQNTSRDPGGTRSFALNSGTMAASLDLTCSSGRSYAIFTSPSSTGLQFYDLTASAERARIDSSGNLLVGKTTAYGAEAYCGYRAADAVFQFDRGNDGTLGVFRRGGTSVGSISVTASATAYNTSSDYRLKENIQPMQNALYVVQQLKPVTYTWKADGSDGQGFIAHELQAVVPDCVTGEKDAIDADGNPVHQGIDTSFLVATLTAAIQEQQALIQQLQADVAALKGQQ